MFDMTYFSCFKIHIHQNSTHRFRISITWISTLLWNEKNRLLASILIVLSLYLFNLMTITYNNSNYEFSLIKYVDIVLIIIDLHHKVAKFQRFKYLMCGECFLTLSLLGYLKTRICWGGVNLTPSPLNSMFDVQIWQMIHHWKALVLYF